MNFLKVYNHDLDAEVKVVSLNRPDVKNAFHPEMISEITEVFKNIQNEKKIKFILLKGEGNIFCSGADLNWMKEMVQYSFEQNIKDSEKLWQMFEAILHCDTPVVGLASGAVYGGAMGLLACCDYVLASEETQFCFSEVKLGLAPAVISSFILKKLSDAQVRPYMLSAEVFNANEAKNMGFIHRVTQKDSLEKEALKKFSANGLEAMRETKKLLNKINKGLSWNDQKTATTTVISERRMSPEGQARLTKYLNKGENG